MELRLSPMLAAFRFLVGVGSVQERTLEQVGRRSAFRPLPKEAAWPFPTILLGAPFLL
jgi:hypothetical protein